MDEGYPDPVLKFLQSVSIEHSTPAYFLVDHEGIVLEAGGQLAAHGLANVTVGSLAEDKLFFLSGLLPVDSVPVHLPAIETGPARHADVHLLQCDEGAWVILFDRSREVSERRIAQQLANDMSLLRNELSRNAEHAVGARPGSTAPEPRFAFSDEGETCPASVVTVIFHDFARTGLEPSEMIRDLAMYARTAARPMVDEAGLVHGLLGDQLRVTFGALPTTTAPASLAVTAARRMLGTIDDMNAARREDGKPAYQMSIGVASGVLTFGLIAGPARRVFTAIGDLYLRSDRLARAAGLDALRIDHATYLQVEDAKRLFERASSGLGDTEDSYVLVMQ